ncbi:MAG TPA: glycosyltransferase family 2 protein [Minicystis sp.]|nr:glycosyltransferase family 2 protein [Minicystis sp.]
MQVEPTPHVEPAHAASPRSEPPPAKALHPQKLLVILPALNEEATIATVIGKIPRSMPGVDAVEVVVVDDGSTDATVALAKKAGASVVSHGRNLGVGAALQSGLEEALNRGADVAVNIDADGQFEPSDIEKLVRAVVEAGADLASASRFKDKSLVPTMPRMKYLGNQWMASIISYLAGQRFADVSCGFRAYSREALLQLVLTGRFTYTQETFLVLASKGLRITEVPIKVRGEREYGKSRVASNLFRYAYRTSGIIFACIRDYRPAAVFNPAAFVLFLLGLAVASFFLWHRITAGRFSPHIWAGFTAGALMGLALVIFALGQVAMMLARIRAVQDRQLYLLRKHMQSPPRRPPP